MRSLWFGVFLCAAIFAACGDDSSSNSVETLGCRTETEDNCEYGELMDERDGQTYKTVKIGDQVWTAQNLNYETENSWCGGGSETTEGDCSVYGRIYTWEVSKSVCPTGWHLPDTTEWKTLFTAVGGELAAGQVLKSTSGWHYSKGTDAFGFSALPAACRNFEVRWGDCRNEGDKAYFWSSTEDGSNRAYLIDLYYNNGDYARIERDYKSYAFSVRCLQD
ncbi:MAG: fibrobacter succinogenes major paralogous domain-containing protein [Fibrobacter sp.]|nr:fibrobacter succinogenes major paralogous domain-containing protein [Fibrobacter sp.]